MINTDQIAAGAVEEICRSDEIAHDIPIRHRSNMIRAVKAAIEKAISDERTKHIVTEGLLIEANKELRAAQASEP